MIKYLRFSLKDRPDEGMEIRIDTQGPLDDRLVQLNNYANVKLTVANSEKSIYSFEGKTHCSFRGMISIKEKTSEIVLNPYYNKNIVVNEIRFDEFDYKWSELDPI